MSIPYGSGQNVSRDLFDQIEHSTGVQQQAAIDKLVERAEASNDPEDWNVAALGLYQGRRFDEEIDILTQLVDKFPANDVYRANLATAYGQIDCIDLCRFHLRYLVEHSSTDEMRRISEDQLRRYEAFLGLGASDTKLRQLQVSFLKESITREATAARNYIVLGRLYTRMGNLEPGSERFTAATEILEKGLTACADRQEILEDLAYSYLHSDPDQRLDVVVKQLEQVAPESRILESLAEVFRQGGGSASEALAGRVRMLMAQVARQDESIAEAALRDLARIVDQHAESSSYRLSYAFALGMNRRLEEALSQAERLDQIPNQEPGFHFNLGSILWQLGDAVRGRRHLELAIQYAANEQEEKDVRDRIAELEALE